MKNMNVLAVCVLSTLLAAAPALAGEPTPAQRFRAVGAKKLRWGDAAKRVVTVAKHPDGSGVVRVQTRENSVDQYDVDRHGNAIGSPKSLFFSYEESAMRDPNTGADRPSLTRRGNVRARRGLEILDPKANVVRTISPLNDHED